MKLKSYLKKAEYSSDHVVVWRDSWATNIALRMTKDGIHFITVPENEYHLHSSFDKWNEDDSLFLTPADLLAKDWVS